MQAITTMAGDMEVLLEVVDDHIEIEGDGRTGRQTRTTGIEDRVLDAMAMAKKVVKNIASEFGEGLLDLDLAIRPKLLEMEFNMGFSLEAGKWLVCGKSDFGIKVKLSWGLGKS